MFYLLSLLTGMLECGWIGFGFIGGYPMWRILGFPLVYQVGNLFPKPFAIGRKLLPVLAAVSCVGSVTVACMKKGSLMYDIITLICIATLSAELQTLRGTMKAGAGKVLKRVCRVAGFAFSPLAAFFPGLVLILISAVSAIEVIRVTASKSDFGESRGIVWAGTAGLPIFRNAFGITMLFHQLHYFIYAYAVLVFMMSRVGDGQAKSLCVAISDEFCFCNVAHFYYQQKRGLL